jgi:uncharacterized Ntn-hydrolase superfamily protein
VTTTQTRPVHTYSIVARDPGTGQLGVAVQSHWFSVGPIVPWAEAGVGAVATQAFVDPKYGPAGLALMRAGRSAPDALKELLAKDSALDAAQAEGGDIRGRQSAALIVVTSQPTGEPWRDRLYDVRVDDHPEPLKELRRLVTLQRAYNHMNAGDLAVEKKDHEGALREYSAAQRLVPGNAEMIFWNAVALVNMGRVDDALPLFRKVFAIDRNWIELTKRLPKSDLLPDDPKIMERILAVAR